MDGVAGVYERFAEIEARGVSPIYEEWGRGISQDPAVCTLISSLPPIKRQPNLVFAAARLRGAPEQGYGQLRDWLIENWAEVVPVILTRSTQTNEAARCAVLLPVLSRLEGALSLIEAGASAGLCLYPDRYSYRYDVGGRTEALDPGTGSSDVVVPCRINAAALPARLPAVVWRAGADLNPLNVNDSDQIEWLEALVWPEHDERRHRLRAAARLAASEPAHLVRGDLLDTIPGLIDQAPAGSRVVVFHSAVLVYLRSEDRERFVELMGTYPDVVWISNEGAGVLPTVTDQVHRAINGRTIVAVNGRARGLAGPHGQSYQSL
ncbi:DUF2332 domain-containing protein [Arthrobacter sp. ZGTC212]|uniref:DUF2332 domain-containing protein n=1 Tax=Arthrobacter sp. ZGTC212 TaxID=2058899 RepID=UPI000CE378D8|nr:DUF2332 domain-containing protein [Arthrobacter sp. ZGTC212]